MWPFGNEKSADKKIRNAFSKYISKDALDEIIRHPEKQVGLSRGKAAYLIFQIRDDILNDVAANLPRGIRAVLNSDGFGDSILSSLVLVRFDFRDDEERVMKLGKRAASIDRLLYELGDNVKIIYGTSDIMHGLIGADEVFRYGSLVCNLAKSIEALSKLEFGIAAEA